MAQSDAPEKQRRRGLRVLVIRHGIAVEPVDFAKSGEPDAQRPLTKPGKRKMRRAARGITRLVPQLDALATSPLTRAIQTADIVAAEYNDISPVHVPGLAPGKSLGLTLTWLQQQKSGGTVAIVGHEPHLGQFVSWVLTGLRESFVDVKKGSACLVEFADEIKPGHAKLLWALRPGQLRAIGRK